MDTIIKQVDPNNIEKAIIDQAGDIILKGGLVAFPTETVYGLGGDALNAESSRKIYAAKGRPSDNPLIIHISEIDSLNTIAADVPEVAQKLIDSFWPGPLTIIFNKTETVPYETTGGLDTVAVRFPVDKIAREFIASAGGFVAAPSANISGRPSPTSAHYVCQDMDGRIDMIIAGDDSLIGLESTIVDVTGKIPMILRPGFITKEMLEDVVGEVSVDQTILSDTSGQAPKAPGMKYRHYAPQGSLVIVEGDMEQVVTYINNQIKKDKDAGHKTGVIATDQTCEKYTADIVFSAGDADNKKDVAHRLFDILRKCDDEDVQKIYSESFADDGLGTAVMNRLLKAAGHNIVFLNGKEE